MVLLAVFVCNIIKQQNLTHFSGSDVNTSAKWQEVIKAAETSISKQDENIYRLNHFLTDYIFSPLLMFYRRSEAETAFSINIYRLLHVCSCCTLKDFFKNSKSLVFYPIRMLNEHFQCYSVECTLWVSSELNQWNVNPQLTRLLTWKRYKVPSSLRLRMWSEMGKKYPWAAIRLPMCMASAGRKDVRN